MSTRPALPMELPAIRGLLARAAARDAIAGPFLPGPFASGLLGWRTLLPGTFGVRGKVHVHVEVRDGRPRAVALVYHGRRPEWVILLLAAEAGTEGAEGAFRLLSGLCAAAARHGMHRLFAAAADGSDVREPFFQTGFYSYTRETWFTRDGRAALPAGPSEGRVAGGRDAHDLFRFYVATTPHAVQRAEQLTVQDFDPNSRAGAFDPPHIGGDPLALRRQLVVLVGDESRPRAFAVAYRGSGSHPHVCKVRTAGGDVDLARRLIRAVAPPASDRTVAMPVRSYDEHIARALELEGFAPAGTAMLFAKELASRIEEPAFAAVPAR